MVMIISIISMAVILSFNFIVFNVAYSQLQSDAKKIAIESIKAIDGNKLEAVINNKSMESTEYKEIQNAMVTFKNDQDIKYFYTLAMEGTDSTYYVVDAALQEELVHADGDYLPAYIRASFRTAIEPEQVSRTIFSAVASDPCLLKPLRAHFERMQSEITSAAPSKEAGTLIRLCMDGLWYSEMYQFAPPDPELRQRLQDMLLELVQKGCFSKDEISQM